MRAAPTPMKEYPNPDYFLRFWQLANEVEPPGRAFLAGGWILSMNHIASVTFSPHLPAAPWPPPRRYDLPPTPTADEVAWVVATMSHQLVAPTDEPGAPELRIEELRYALDPDPDPVPVPVPDPDPVPVPVPDSDPVPDPVPVPLRTSAPLWLQTIFWVPRPRFAAILRDIDDLLYTPRDHPAPPRRLFALPDGELRRFLQRDYPRAASLTAYEREILCLDEPAPR